MTIPPASLMSIVTVATESDSIAMLVSSNVSDEVPVTSISMPAMVSSPMRAVTCSSIESWFISQVPNRQEARSPSAAGAASEVVASSGWVGSSEAVVSSAVASPSEVSEVHAVSVRVRANRATPSVAERDMVPTFCGL